MYGSRSEADEECNVAFAGDSTTSPSIYDVDRSGIIDAGNRERRVWIHSVADPSIDVTVLVVPDCT